MEVCVQKPASLGVCFTKFVYNQHRMHHLGACGSFFRVTGPLGNSPITGEFPLQRASNADFDVSLMLVRISC